MADAEAKTVAATEQHYQIDQQSLAQALIAVAEACDRQILFRPELLPDGAKVSLIGQHSLTEALAQLLGPYQLAFKTLDSGVIVIYAQEPAATPSQQAPEPRTQLSIDTQARQLEEIWVTGYKASLARNLDLKRRAGNQVDAISAEDIGKFPDKNVADALQRVPGVSVDRIWGEGRDINIRGTDKDVNRTLMNGQNVASGYWWANDNASRGFNYSLLPSELVETLEVHKSPSANMDEGSIGGTVNIITRRPLDLPDGLIQGSLEALYSELPDSWNPQGSVLTNWHSSQEEFGVLAVLSYQSRDMRRDGLEAFPDNLRYDFVDQQGQSYSDVQVPWGLGSALFQQERERSSFNISAQWQPTSGPMAGLDMLYNGVYSKLDMDNINQNYLAIPGGFKFSQPGPILVENPQLTTASNGDTTLIGGRVSDSPGLEGSAGAALDAIVREAQVETQVHDLDINWKVGAHTLHGQLGYTRAQGGSDHDRLYRFIGNTRIDYQLSQEQINVSFPDLEPRNAEDLRQFSEESHDWIRQMSDRETYAQLDWQWQPDTPLGQHWRWQGLALGAKWRDHRIENTRNVGEFDRNSERWSELANTSLIAVSRELSPVLHQAAGSSRSLNQYALLDANAALALSQDYADIFSYDFDYHAYYRIDEHIAALYAKSEFTSERHFLDLGLRYVDTHQDSRAYREENLQSFSIAEHQRQYSEWLPSLNWRFSASNTVIVRASAARVMARPTFVDLAPNLVVDATSGALSGGNPNLQPFISKQFDLGGEWYFTDSALLSLTGFYKDLSTFVYSRDMAEDIAGTPRPVARPVNAPGARISGFELQWQQELYGGFGISTNYTFTNADVPSHQGSDSLNLPGNSRDQVNLTGFYERGSFSGRLSYNYRSKSFGGFTGGAQDITQAYDQWDASVSWQFNDQLSAVIEAINLGNEVVYYQTSADIPRGIYENGRRFSLGLRFSF